MKRQSLNATLTGRTKKVITRTFAIYAQGGHTFRVYFATGKIVKVK